MSEARRVLQRMTSALVATNVLTATGDHALNPDFDITKPATPAAVLILLHMVGDELHVVFTRRTAHLTAHAGQISFPGGRVEKTDKDAIETALRETEEEIGLPRTLPRVLGHLPDYRTRTGFSITPVVAAIDALPTLTADTHEVDEIFSVPLTFFLDPLSRQKHDTPFEGKTRSFYAYHYNQYFIWGATAGILNQLAQLYTQHGTTPPPPTPPQP